MLDPSATSAVFEHIYARNIWGGGSGPSSPAHNAPYMQMLADFMRSNDVRTVVDIGCGDWQHARAMDWTGKRYQGFDVVPGVIETNATEFATPTVTFHLLRRMDELPKADLAICKDVLQHLPNADVCDYLDFMFDRFKFAIVTNDVSWSLIHPVRADEAGNRTNVDIRPGEYRQLRLDWPPFNRRVKSLMHWDVIDPPYRSTKNACLLLGSGCREIVRLSRGEQQPEFAGPTARSRSRP